LKNKHINGITFSSLNDEALLFYHHCGWVVLTGIVDQVCLDRLSLGWKGLVQRYRKEVGCCLDDYNNVISQWRDLWKELPDFHAVIKSPLAQLAAASFGLSGARLLHDHIICKTAGLGNGIVPWHQDSMYWPVDRTGMSTWMSYVDVPVEHGCLEVVSGSHLWEVSKPVDFMSEETGISEQSPSVLLPVKAGDVILLHSRTWHRSQETSVSTPRPGHIVLWVPPATRYWQSNAVWHPLNEQISVKNNCFLNEDEFPIVGCDRDEVGSTFENKHVGVPAPFGMFNALDRVRNKIEFLLFREGRLSDLLRDRSSRNELCDKVMRIDSGLERHVVDKIIVDVWISGSSFELHRARNVFNSAYKKWEDLIETVGV